MGMFTLGLLLSTVSIYTSDAFIPNLRGLSCIISDPIEKDSIRLNYTASQINDGEWSLSYNISWKPPGDLAYIIYFAELSEEGRDRPLTPWNFARCEEVLEHADELKKLEKSDFKNIPYHLSTAHFTSRYLFQVSYGDAASFLVPVSLGTSIIFETPDCYTVTGDVEFCSSHDVYRCGVPTNVRLVAMKPGLLNDTAMASFEWSSPVQVNSMATIAEYRLQIYSNNGDQIISDTVYHSTDEPSHQWVANPRPYQDEPIMEGLCYKLTIMPYITYIYGNGSLYAGRKIELKFWANLTASTAVAEMTTETFATEWKTEENQNGRNSEPIEITTDGTSTTNNLRAVIIAIISFLVVVCITLALFILLRKRWFRAANRNRAVENIFFGGENIYKTIELENEVDPLLKDKEVSHDKVILHEKLGEGEFGVVYKGVVHGINLNNKEVICAVKMPKVGAGYDANVDLLSEMKLVADLGDHQNILSLLACCSRKEPYYLVTEFMKYGDLLTFLRKCRQRDKAAEDPMYYIEETKQVFIAYEIAKGMAYIQEKQFYHGDLAARNILVGDELRIKISDFGLADDIYTRGYKRREVEQKIPIKWCSLETILKGLCSSQGDVWSFGVLLYEVFTLGGTPYPGIAARYLVSQLREGYRMEQPENCPDDMYETMLSCWQEEPNNRPTFHVIEEKLDAMLVKRSDYLKFEKEDELFNDTTDERDDLKRASYLSNTFIQNFKFTPPEKQNDEAATTIETFAPILEEENDIELTELEAILHNEK